MDTAGERNAMQQVDIVGPMRESKGVHALQHRCDLRHRFGTVKQIHHPHLVAGHNRAGRRIRHLGQPAGLAGEFDGETEQTEDLVAVTPKYGERQIEDKPRLTV